MKITSKNSQLLNEIHNDLKRKEIRSKKVTKEVKGAMGDVSVYIELAGLALASIEVLITYLKYRQSQKKNSIHIKYRDGLDFRWDNLSKEERDIQIAKLKKDFSKLEYFHIG